MAVRYSHPLSGTSSPSLGSVACTIATNASPPDALWRLMLLTTTVAWRSMPSCTETNSGLRKSSGA